MTTRRSRLTATQHPVRHRAVLTFDPSPLIVATGGTLRQTARMLDLDPANLCRPLSSRQADSYATRLGYHPEEIWGAAWNDQDE